MKDWIDILAENQGTAWITSGILFGSIVLAMWVARFIGKRYLPVLAARTKSRLDDILLVIIKKTNMLLVGVVALNFAQKALTMPEQFPAILRIATISAVFLQVALWGNAIISFYLAEAAARATASGQLDTNISARRAIGFLARLLLWAMVLALLLENLGVRLSPLLAGIGIGGIAIALAVQNILGDLFCYVAIILDKPFVNGDFLVIDNFSGKVERIGMKTTRVRSLSGELIVMANHDLVNSRIRNYKFLEERRVVMKFGVTYETALDDLKVIPEIVRSIFDALPNARLDRVHFAQFGNFSLDFEVVYFVLSQEYNVYMDVQQTVNLRLMELFLKQGIEFAYPTQTLYMHNAGKTEHKEAAEKTVR